MKIRHFQSIADAIAKVDRYTFGHGYSVPPDGLIHLDSGPRDTDAACGIKALGQNDINFVTCPACRAAHENEIGK